MGHASARLERAAAILVAAREARMPFDRFPEACMPRDQLEGYAVQDAVLERLAGTLGPRVGWKIGCTTAVMQAYLGIDAPCAGGVPERTVHATGCELEHASFQRPGVECELAVVLGGDLPAAAAPFRRETVRPAVEACLAAIELVEDRYVDYRALDAAALIADDFFAAGCVLGPQVPIGRVGDLAEVRATMLVDGVEVGTGRGEAILGHPLDALAWLATSAAARGRALRAGEFVLLGSVVQTCWVDRGAAVVVESPELGEVRVRFR